MYIYYHDKISLGREKAKCENDEVTRMKNRNENTHESRYNISESSTFLFIVFEHLFFLDFQSWNAPATTHLFNSGSLRLKEKHPPSR